MIYLTAREENLTKCEINLLTNGSPAIEQTVAGVFDEEHSNDGIVVRRKLSALLNRGEG